MIPRLLTSEPPASLMWRGAERGGHELRWLGAAGFVLSAGQRHLVIDPFVSRRGLLGTVFGRLRPDEEAVARWVPKADAVLVGHAHFDHALDAPAVCRQHKARLYGSTATANIARAYGLEEELIVPCAGFERLDLGYGHAVPLPSQHGRVYFNRVSLPGDIPSPPPWPPRFNELRHGQVFSWWAEWQGLKLMHIDSADYDTALMQGREADVLCLCAIGRRYRPGYTAEIIAALRPRWVVACHWEDFFAPVEAAPRALPGVDLPGFVREIQEAGAEAIVTAPGQSFGID